MSILTFTVELVGYFWLLWLIGLICFSLVVRDYISKRNNKKYRINR